MNAKQAAQFLGRMARGIPKTLTQAERDARRDRMAHARRVLAERRALVRALATNGAVKRIKK